MSDQTDTTTTTTTTSEALRFSPGQRVRIADEATVRAAWKRQYPTCDPGDALKCCGDVVVLCEQETALDFQHGCWSVGEGSDIARRKMWPPEALILFSDPAPDQLAAIRSLLSIAPDADVVAELTARITALEDIVEDAIAERDAARADRLERMTAAVIEGMISNPDFDIDADCEDVGKVLAEDAVQIAAAALAEIDRRAGEGK